MSNNKRKNTDTLSIDYDLEPWTRKWCGGIGTHPFNNQAGGAFGLSKKEFHRQMEARNRQKRSSLKKK